VTSLPGSARLIPNSFASQLLLLFAVALLVPLGFLATLIASDISGAEQAANRLAVRQAKQAAVEIEHAYARDTELATILSGLPEFWNGSDEDRDRILTSFSSPYPSLSGMLFFTDDFEQHGRANFQPRSERHNLAIRAYAREAVATGRPAFADEITTGRSTGRQILSLVNPLREPEPGVRHGFITAAFLADQLPSLWKPANAA
jgi:hypothetical protein